MILDSRRYGKCRAVAGCLLAVSLTVFCAEADREGGPLCAFAVVPFGSVYEAHERAPVAAIVINGGNEAIYVQELPNLAVELRDEGGSVIKDTRPKRKPPPIPPTHRMERNGRTIIVRPVHEIPPKQTFTRVFPDILLPYRGRLKPGRYTMRLTVDAVFVYSRHKAIAREGVGHRHWVRAADKPDCEPAWSGTIEFRIQSGAAGRTDWERSPSVLAAKTIPSTHRTKEQQAMRMPIALLLLTPLACVGCALAEDAIFELARTGDIEGLQKEVARGADVNSRDRYGSTPLMHAVTGRQVRLCEFLLARGADPAMRDRKGPAAQDYVSVLVRQAKQRTQQLGGDTDRDLASLLRIQALLQQAQAKQRSPQRGGLMSSVVGVIDKNELSELERLVKQGFDINEKGPQGMTALAYAASVGNVGACELLLRRGADLHIRDNQGLIAYGQIERGKTDHATKARLRAFFKKEIRRRDLATVARLIKGGMDINLRDRHGRTPLMRAAARGNVDACKVMLDHGADVEARDRDGLSVHDYVCKERGDEEARARIVELLNGAEGSRRPRR